MLSVQITANPPHGPNALVGSLDTELADDFDKPDDSIRTSLMHQSSFP